MRISDWSSDVCSSDLHLKWTLETFLKAFFERDDIVLRLRPSYFPFTEPSVEVDVGYSMEKGQRVIGGAEGWMEVLGSGMVHPNVRSEERSVGKECVSTGSSRWSRYHKNKKKKDKK